MESINTDLEILKYLLRFFHVVRWLAYDHIGTSMLAEVPYVQAALQFTHSMIDH